jgi:hypothetical protein
VWPMLRQGAAGRAAALCVPRRRGDKKLHVFWLQLESGNGPRGRNP